MRRGFTLAELLIALAILGVIATFTIPKVLQSQADGRRNAGAKESIATFSASLEQYKLNNPLTATTEWEDVIDAGYVNYVKVYTGQFDMRQGEANNTCANTDCILMHNGAVLVHQSTDLGGTGTTNAFMFYYDPEAGYSGTTDTGKSIQVFVYPNGMVRTRGSTLPNTIAATLTFASPNAALDPSWFSWSQ